MNPYLKYSSMVFQLVLFILAGFYLGKLSARFTGFPETYSSIFGLLFFLLTGLYKIIRDIYSETNS